MAKAKAADKASAVSSSPGPQRRKVDAKFRRGPKDGKAEFAFGTSNPDAKVAERLKVQVLNVPVHHFVNKQAAKLFLDVTVYIPCVCSNR